MNQRGIIFEISDNFIHKLAQLIIEVSPSGSGDFSRIACVFGGKRPALFLRRAIAEKLNKSFVPPAIFSMDEYITYLSDSNPSGRALTELEAAYIIYKLACSRIHGFVKRGTSFANFMPWAREITAFMSQLDLECVGNDKLLSIEKNARIGFDVPESINKLLQNIVLLRELFEAETSRLKFVTRARLYRDAAKIGTNDKLKDFDRIFFCGNFYLHKTEITIIKAALDAGRGTCVFHGAPNNWSMLKRVFSELEIPLVDDEYAEKSIDFSLHKGYDTHTQVALVADIFENKIADKDDTVIVLPRPETVVPLLTRIGLQLDKCNVSMGYPFKRTAVYVLFDLIYRAQESRRDDGRYYVKDYLSVLRHPLIKNISFGQDSAITRVIAHKIEETILGQWRSAISGSVFIDISKISADARVITEIRTTLANMSIMPNAQEIADIVTKLHDFCFSRWQGITNFNQFSIQLKNSMDILIAKSKVLVFPFAAKSLKKVYAIIDEFSALFFGEDDFDALEVFSIFLRRLDGEIVPFIGSPLSGTQVLGLFETRLLNFKNIIIIDVNEGCLPKLKVMESLIPREVMLMLGLNRLEKEEEIQRYQFKRLLSGAENNYIIYSSNNVNERSRFIEELIWEKQRKKSKLEVLNVSESIFNSKISIKNEVITKSDTIVNYLREQTYSASRIDVYLNCPLQFYYKYVLGLKEKDGVEDDLDSIGVGIFLHGLLEEAYKPFIGKNININKSFRKRFFTMLEAKFNEEITPKMRSGAVLLKKILKAKLETFLDKEELSDTKRIMELENRRLAVLSVDAGEVSFQYTIDRLEELKDGTIMVTDYKTGSIKKIPKSLGLLEKMAFSREGIKKNIQSFQLPLYYHFTRSHFPNKIVNAQLYSIRDLTKTVFIGSSEISSSDRREEICLDALSLIFNELFDINKPFIADKEENKCKYCPFIDMCS